MAEKSYPAAALSPICIGFGELRRISACRGLWPQALASLCDSTL